MGEAAVEEAEGRQAAEVASGNLVSSNSVMFPDTCTSTSMSRMVCPPFSCHAWCNMLYCLTHSIRPSRPRVSSCMTAGLLTDTLPSTHAMHADHGHVLCPENIGAQTRNANEIFADKPGQLSEIVRHKSLPTTVGWSNGLTHGATHRLAIVPSIPNHPFCIEELLHQPPQHHQRDHELLRGRLVLVVNNGKSRFVALHSRGFVATSRKPNAISPFLAYALLAGVSISVGREHADVTQSLTCNAWLDVDISSSLMPASLRRPTIPFMNSRCYYG